MQAITTKFLGPTNTKPTRIVASNPDGKRVVMSLGRAEQEARRRGYLDAISFDGAQRAVAETLAEQFNWLDDGSRLVGGGIGHGNMVWVFVETVRNRS